MPVDVDAVLIDILSLIQQKAGIRLSGKPSHSKDGLEYHSNCPFPDCRGGGGRDRFAIWPQIGRYSCAIRSSGCGRYGDAIDFLRTYPYENAMTYVEACDELGIDVDPAYRSFKYPAIQEDDTLAPPKKWQETGMIILDRAEHRLWNSPDGLQMVEYLHNRGLKDEILKKKRFGYIPLNEKTGRMFEMSFDAWGLTPEMLSEIDKEKGCVRIPEGILIPWFVGGNLWKLTMKRPSMPKGKDYGQILGGGKCLYNADLVSSGCPVMITESVLDAISVEQEAGDLITVVGTDGTKGSRQPRWLALLCKAPYVFQSFDGPDEDGKQSGEEGAQYWIESLPDCMRHEPFAHDPNDMLREGQDIRKWVQLGMKMYQTPAMPLEQSVVGKEADEQERTIGDESLPQKCVVCGLDALLYPDVDFAYSEEGTLYCLEHCGTATPDDTAGTTGVEQETIEEEILSPPLTLEQYCRQKYPGKKIREYVPPLPLPVKKEYWEDLHDKLERQGYYKQVEKDRERILAKVAAYKKQWGLSA